MPSPQDLNPIYWLTSLGEYLAANAAPGSRLQNWIQALNQSQERFGQGLSKTIGFPFEVVPLQPPQPLAPPPPLAPTVTEAKTSQIPLTLPPIGNIATAGDLPNPSVGNQGDAATQAILDLYKRINEPVESPFERLVKEVMEANKPKPPPTDFFGALFGIKPGEGWNNVNNFLDSPIVNRLQRLSRAATAPQQYALQQQQAENAARLESAQANRESRLTTPQALGLILSGQNQAQQVAQGRFNQQAQLLQLMLEMQKFNRQLEAQQAQLLAELAKAQRAGDLDSIRFLSEALVNIQRARQFAANTDMTRAMMPNAPQPGATVVTPRGAKVTVIE